MVVVVAVGGFAVLRIHGIFGSQKPLTYAGSMPDRTNNSDPKHLVYEIFGPPGTFADINYVDNEGEPRQVNKAPVPWSVEIVTNAPALMGNIVAQGNSDFLGCRIITNGIVKDERSSSEVSAYVYCFAKTA